MNGGKINGDANGHSHKINYEKQKQENNIKYDGKTGGEVIVEKLREHQVSDVFMYSGGAVMPVIDAFHNDPDFNYYITAHEQSLGHAATGYAKVSGKTGVAIVTSGPGLTNMVTPILDATNDSAPLLCISGQVPLAAMGSSAFQECPATDITKSITKWNYCLQSTEEIPYVIDHAMWLSQHGKKGAVHIDVPKCVSASKYSPEKAMNLNDQLFELCSHPENSEEFDFSVECPDDKLLKSNRRSYEWHGKIKNLQHPVDKETFKKMANLINNASCPVFYIGQGCENSADLLTKAAIEARIPVTTTLHAMGLFDETHELALKMCGMHGNYAANHALQKADLIIAVGSRFDDRTTGVINKYAPVAQAAAQNGTGGIIHCNIQPCQINKVLTTDFNFLMDSRIFLENLVPHLKSPTNPQLRENWLDTINEWKMDYPYQFLRAPDNQIKTQDVIKGINEYVLNYVRPTQNNNDKSVIITTGVGNHQMYSTQFVDWYRPNKIVSSGSLGVMGSSNGYAIGAQIADLKNNLVISIDGDGSFNMTSSELMTMIKYNLPIKIAIMNDGSLQMVKVWEKLFYGERYVATHNPCNPDYVQLAESYGLKALRCDNINSLNETVAELIESDGPVLCDFKVLGEECYPLVAPGKALDDMILWDTSHQETMKKMEGQMAPS
eukprot:CAMPEP_0201564168 /NCGR_PEP_ID=MMETSP0190_2-20130828/2202_1 /ASSEMBLY_ACC=CAM_ASM_000263 /TAXON_ID=37353 /ORGANISM="Rosalina sp." /LENGTH=665 /DNA_ID=CAMNT_0047979975 /DNA_START=200 /DNA_END=2197 /DNA_ORIENTATION=-